MNETTESISLCLLLAPNAPAGLQSFRKNNASCIFLHILLINFPFLLPFLSSLCSFPFLFSLRPPLSYLSSYHLSHLLFPLRSFLSASQ